MTESPKLLKITNIDNKLQLYYGNLVIVDKINSVYFQDAIYRARDNSIVTSTGRKSIMSLVQSGYQVFYLS